MRNRGRQLADELTEANLHIVLLLFLQDAIKAGVQKDFEKNLRMTDNYVFKRGLNRLFRQLLMEGFKKKT